MRAASYHEYGPEYGPADLVQINEVADVAVRGADLVLGMVGGSARLVGRVARSSSPSLDGESAHIAGAITNCANVSFADYPERI